MISAICIYLYQKGAQIEGKSYFIDTTVFNACKLDVKTMTSKKQFSLLPKA